MLLSEKIIFSRLSKVIKNHNQVQESRSKRITNARASVLRTITFMYVKKAQEAVSLPEWTYSTTLPTVYTNRQELARLAECCSRSVYNHISLLIEAGILRKQLHGRQNDFELMLHPFITFGENYEAPAAQNLTPQPVLPLDERKTLPPISSYESNETCVILSNRTSKPVEMWKRSITVPAEQVLTEFSVVNTTRIIRNDSGNEKSDNLNASSSIRTGLGGAAATDLTVSDKFMSGTIAIGPAFERSKKTQLLTELLEKLQINPSQQDNDEGKDTSKGVTPLKVSEEDLLLNKKRQLTVDFWSFIKKVFYPVTQFSDSHERKILNLLWNDLFCRFQGDNTIEKAVNRYLELIKQADLALIDAKRRNWTSFQPPLVYFSIQHYKAEKANNKRGNFHWTSVWIHDAWQKKQNVIKKDTLEKAKHSILTQKAPRGLKDAHTYTPIKLYHYWEHRLKKLCDSKIINQFYEFCKTVKYYEYGN